METYDIAQLIKTHLEADTTLNYIDCFDIGQYEEDPLPNFETRCVQISLSAESTGGIGGTAYQVSQETLEFDLVVIVKNFDPVKSIHGGPGEEGILKITGDLKKSIREFAQTTGLDFRGNETQRPIGKTTIPEREGFFREYKLPVTIRLEAEIS